ncbi:MAG: hypothetical protein ACK4R8_03275 [Thiobacillus sp.]
MRFYKDIVVFMYAAAMKNLLVLGALALAALPSPELAVQSKCLTCHQVGQDSHAAPEDRAG